MILPDVLSPGDLSLLLAQPDASLWFGRRDRLVLALMARCGLRVSEVCGLTVDQVKRDESGGYWLTLRNVKRTRGSGNKKRANFRNIPTPGDVSALIGAWLERDLPAGSTYFVPNRRGLRPIDRHACYRMVRRYSERAGIGQAWCHLLRHTAATEMLEAGLDLPEVRQVLGHSSLAVTSVYLHVRPERLQSKMSHWTREVKELS